MGCCEEECRDRRALDKGGVMEGGVSSITDIVKCMYPNAATCSRSRVSVNDPKIGSVFVFLACVLP